VSARAEAATSLKSAFVRPTPARIGRGLRASRWEFALAGAALVTVIASNQIDWSADRLNLRPLMRTGA
jgi:hypothetical protein